MDGTVDGPARRLTFGDLVVDRDLTRSAFLASSVGRAAPTIVANEPWHSWSVEATIDGEPWGFGLYFQDEALMFVSFGGGEDRFGPAWETATEEARRRYHDEAIARWGLDAWSGIDPKGGFANVVVRYRD